MIDLPGITKIAQADQDQDIERLTREMSERYIGDERTIILAVSAANQDISNSIGLQLARKFDPQGVRTIGVLTKIDIMDAGTDVRSLINNLKKVFSSAR